MATDLTKPDPEDRRPTHFEIELDDPPPNRAPVYVDITDHGLETRHPIIPAGWRGWTNIKKSLKREGENVAHRVGFHTVRAPLYAALTSLWAVVGVFRLAGRQLRWWWHPELAALLQTAATRGDLDRGPAVERQLAERRRQRGLILLAELLALGVLAAAIWYGPWWIATVAALVAIPYLAHVGHPAGRPIITAAIVQPRFRKLNADIVLRAYYAAKLGHPERPDQQIKFGSVMARDGDGSRVVIDLPYGGTFAEAVNAKDKIASGLDVSSFQVFLTRDRSSQRRHTLWVADQDPLAIPAGRTPLLDCRPRDIWQPAFLGLDERAQPVMLTLMWVSVLVGAQPRKGKTFTARLIALYAALDPYVKITIADGKNSPDWAKFRLVAHRMIFGTVPNGNDRDPINNLLAGLYEIKAHIERVNDILSRLPVSECPDGKLTRDLSRKYPELRVWVLVMEEFQTYFETDDQDVNKEIAGLLSFIMAVGPSAGVIIESSSQKPSGVGAGDVARLFNRYRDNHAVRIALKCGNRDVSIAVLGGDAYQEGYDASALPVGPEYRGVGYLYGAADATPLVRWHLADAEDSEKILTAARRHREVAGTLTGQAAGEDMSREYRDVLADVRRVFYAGEAWISWQQLASRLAEQMPEHYADVTADAVSAQVRGLKLGIKSESGRLKEDVGEHAKGAVLQGVKLKAVDAAIDRRSLNAAA